MKAIVGIVIAAVLVNAVWMAERKEVNIALETVLRFDKKDQTPGLTVIDKVEDALVKIKENLLFRRNNPNTMTYTDISGRRSNSRDITFTDFILQAAKILNEYDDNDLEDAFAVIYDESRRYINRESGLDELFGISDVRRHFSEQLDDFKDVPAKQLRRHLDKAITAVENKQKTGEKNDILDIGNFLYLGSGDKFRAALKNLERLHRTKDVRVEVTLKDILRSLVFDHYSNLNDGIKRELIEMAKDYWRVYSRKAGKNSRILDSESPETNFNYKKSNKYDHENKHPIKVYKNKLSHKTVHKNKRYTNKLRTPRDHEYIPADVEVNKFINNTRSPAAFTRSLSPAPKVEFKKASSVNSKNDKPYLKSKKYKSMINNSSPASSKEHKVKSIEEVSDESDFMVLIGGQNSANIGKSGHVSTEKSSKQPKKKKDDIHFSTETDKQHRTTAVISVENVRSESSKSDEDDLFKENRFTVLSPGLKNIEISREGLTIESFENEPPIVNKVMRKNNADDILGFDNPGTSDVKEMIKDIEKQIKVVKEDISYVRNLTISTDKPSKPIFKAVYGDEKPSPTLSKAKSSYHYPDSDAIDRDNEAFFSRDHLENFSTEKPPTRFAFRANDNADTTNGDVTLKKQNDTKTTVIETTTFETIATTTYKPNDTKLNISLQNTINKEDNEINNNKTEVVLISNINKTNSINVDDVTDINVKIDDKLNEIDNKNTTLEEKHYEHFALVPKSKMNLNFTTKSLPDALNDRIESEDADMTY